MDCKEFLENYSDFLDRRLEARPLSDYREHLSHCASCVEYDRVIRRGLHVIRELDPPEPPPDFLPRLQYRVLDMQAGSDRRASRSGPMSALVVLSSVGLLVVASLGVMRVRGGAVELPPVVVEVPVDAGATSSLWGPAPKFDPPASLLQVSVFPRENLFVPPSERLSLFRAPLRVSTTSPEPDRVEAE